MDQEKIIYKDLSYKINGLFYQVHNQLGRFCREKQYCDLLEKKLIENKIKYKREARIGDSGNIVDFIIEDVIVIEVKAKPMIEKIDYYQLQRYLESIGLKLGLLVNFQCRYIKAKRVLNSKV
jgi:GxxExxY protein